MLLDNWLAQRAEACPDRPALVEAGRTLDYAELEREAVAAARRLAARGARRNSTVALSLRPGIDWAIALHALMKLGTCALLLDPGLSEDERSRIERLAGPSFAIDVPTDLGSHEADLPLLGEVDLDAVFTKVLTSGTSGSPKLVELTYGRSKR